MSVHKFYSLKVNEITKITKDSVKLTFDIPIELKETFQFKSGQYLTLRQEINSEAIRRSYSICTAPEEDKCSVSIKKIENGKFSTFANEVLRVGDYLDVMPPLGNFTLDSTPKNHFLFFAAGSGITPILSHIKHILFTTAKTKITLIFGNKNFGSIMFREELEALKNKYIDRLSIHHIFTKEKVGVDLLYGRIDSDKCKKLAKHIFNIDDINDIYLCGPADMIFDVKDTLIEIGVPANKIHFELFNTEGLKRAKVVSQLQESDKEKVSEVSIQMDGDLFEFSLEYGGQNLLDAALAAGVDLPYACKGGVCCTCKAKITEGKVVMDLNYALEPEEVENGYVLLCQSHPRTSSIYVDFDQK